MNEHHQKIGRFILLKHCLIFIGIVLLVPIIIELVESDAVNIPRAIKGAFKLNSIDSGDLVYLLVHITVLGFGVWRFGGKAGQSIIAKEKPKFMIGSMAIFKLWILHIISATSLQVIVRGFELKLSGWFIIGLLWVLLIGLAHGFIGGYLLTKEIWRKGRAVRDSTSA